MSAAWLEEQFSLEGKNVVITGGAGVIAGAMAAACLGAGARVALWGRTPENLEEQKSKLNGGDSVLCVTSDLTSTVSAAEALDKTIAYFGRVDALINAVGGSSVRTPFVDLSENDYSSVLNLNLVAGCVIPSQLVCRYWIRNSLSGAMLNIASMASYVPLSGAMAYSAAKSAVINQTQALACELAPENIRVNAIAPGFFLGKQNRRLLTNADGSCTERGNNVLHHTPMKRFGQPAELGGATVFLLSDSASFITGVTLPVDGGYLCWNI